MGTCWLACICWVTCTLMLQEKSPHEILIWEGETEREEERGEGKAGRGLVASRELQPAMSACGVGGGVSLLPPSPPYFVS